MAGTGAFQANSNSAPEARAQVKYGSNQDTNALFVGQSVAQVRFSRADAWSIPTNAKAYRGTTEVGEDYVLIPGDVVEFARRQGDKG